MKLSAQRNKKFRPFKSFKNILLAVLDWIGFRLVSWFLLAVCLKKDIYSKNYSQTWFICLPIRYCCTVGDFGTLELLDKFGPQKHTLVWHTGLRDEEFGSRLIDTTQWDSHPHDNFHLTLVWTQSLTIIITPGNQKTEHFLYIENYRLSEHFIQNIYPIWKISPDLFLGAHYL